jgi:hypothetical protein
MSVDDLHLLMAAVLPEKRVPEVRATVFGAAHIGLGHGIDGIDGVARRTGTT